LLLFTQGTELPDGTAAFASGIVGMYTEVIGDWSWWIIAAAAFSAMLGTCIACLDGYSRALARAYASLFQGASPREATDTRGREQRTLLMVSAGALVLILAFPQDIRTLVDVATTLSFLVAPLVAAANWYLVSREEFPEAARPRLWLHALAGLGLLFLVGFSWLFLRA
jgi:Mn2+/Fe2+ NRAMP family transporter